MLEPERRDSCSDHDSSNSSSTSSSTSSDRNRCDEPVPGDYLPSTKEDNEVVPFDILHPQIARAKSAPSHVTLRPNEASYDKPPVDGTDIAPNDIVDTDILDVFIAKPKSYARCA